MPRGAAVVKYEGSRGTTWRIKYVDASGVQVMETIGRAVDGVSERDAKRALRARLVDIERDRWRRPDVVTFEAFTRQFLDEYLPSRGLKKSTRIDYQHTIEHHLSGYFGSIELADLEAAPQHIDRYIAAKTNEGLAAKTIRNHLTTLSVMFRVAMRWRLVRSNPVALIDRPKTTESEIEILSDAEIAALLVAFHELESDADERERPWWATTRRLVVVALGTALRRGELLGLRWQDVALLERRVSVRQTFVRNEFTTPKSRSSRRTIEAGSRVVDALQEQWAASRYHGDSDVVFGHPLIGTPLDPTKLTRGYLRPALKKAGIVKPFRPWHGLRHTALTHEAAAGNPQAYIQLKAGHSQGSITERYIHAAQVLFPGAADKAEARMFGPSETPSEAEGVETG